MNNEAREELPEKLDTLASLPHLKAKTKDTLQRRYNMSQSKAVYYGQLELILGMTCDGYVLDDDTTAMSVLGVADLLSIHHKTLQNTAAKGIPKSLRSFWNKDLNTATKNVLVTAKDSHVRGRIIEVFESSTIEHLIKAYAYAFAHDKLRDNQKHIGKRCVLLIGTFIKTALDAAIKEACGFNPHVQKTIQKNYDSAVSLLIEFGFKCSISKEIAIKKDIINFLKIPAGTLNSFLYKHGSEIKAIKLNYEMIKASGYKAKRMNGYHIKDVAKIAFGTDTAIGMKLKKRMFGEIANIARVNVKDEIKWRKTLTDVFAGYDLRFNYSIGSHRLRVDFFVAELLLCLECNGYSHCYYEPKWEAQREKIITEKYSLIRFHHETRLECLFNAILKAHPGKVIRLYNNKKVTLKKFLST